MILVTVTVGFFLDEEVTFTLIFLEETVKIVPFLAGFTCVVVGLASGFDGVGVGVGFTSGVDGVVFSSGCDGVGSVVPPFPESSPDVSPGVAVSPINLTGILFFIAYLCISEFL